MNTIQLECFSAVADTLNFSRAAEYLGLTQPAVSHQIKTLEDELGVSLFSRTSKSVRLTEEGYIFLEYAGEMLKLAGLSKSRVRQCRTERPIRLGIGCRSAGGLRLIRPALEQLRQAVPGVLPALRVLPLGILDNLMAEGEVQVILTFRENVPHDSTYQELALCPVVCMCRADHPLAGEEFLTTEQLRDLGPLAVCRPPVCFPAMFTVQGQLIAESPPSQLIFCESQEALLTLVEAGYACAVSPDFPQLRLPGLRYIPLADCQPLSFGAAWRDGPLSPVLRHFLHILRQTMGA